MPGGTNACASADTMLGTHCSHLLGCDPYIAPTSFHAYVHAIKYNKPWHDVMSGHKACASECVGEQASTLHGHPWLAAACAWEPCCL